MNHLDEFKRAWESSDFIKIELDPVNVNDVLRERYTYSPNVSMTKSQLWDMEVRKASRPDLFIPSVIKQGTASSWGRKRTGHIETFMRVSQQRLWLDEEQYGVVIENVHVDHKAQTVTFIGESAAHSALHGNFSADGLQPIFHVQHGVTGEEDNPENTWKIVHLTSEDERHINERFEANNRSRWLPEYIEIYLSNMNGVHLDRAVC